MSTDIPALKSSTRLSLGVASVVAVLTIGFHILLAERPYGISFALFVVILVVGMHVIEALSGRRGNTWAYLFLVPVLFSTIANLLFASDVVRVLSFPLVFGSLIFFSYWFTSPPILFHDVLTFWPQSLFFEAILPLEDTKGFFEGFTGMSQGKRILTGLAIAFPFLVVIGALFISADPLFKAYVAKFFFLDHVGVGKTIFQLIRDAVVALFLLRTGWAMLTRALHHRHPQGGVWNPYVDSVVLTTFMGSVNALFLAFLAFQFVYFFGGEQLVQSQGLTYADYARHGFFELLAVAGIVFGLVWVVYRITSMRSFVTRILSVVLIAQTVVVIASAIKRLNLYVDVYGMTLSRWWAYAVILLVGLVLLTIGIASFTKMTYQMLAKVVCLGVLIASSFLLLLNSEGRVASWNVSHVLTDTGHGLDAAYLSSLSSDAIPALLQLSNMSFKDSGQSFYMPCHLGPTLPQECLREFLAKQKIVLEDRVKSDWRNAVWSDYRALAALRSLQ